MPKATANGREFTFPEGTSPEQMGQAIDEFFASQAEPQAPVLEAQDQAPAGMIRDEVIDAVEVGRRAREQTGASALETIGTFGTAVAAEPIAGVAGLATAAVAGSEAGAEAVEATREALTLDPVSEQGRTNLINLSKKLEPLANLIQTAEQAGGDIGFDLAGPIGATIGASLPTAIPELLGLGAAVKFGRTASKIDDLAKRSRINLVDNAGNVTDDAIDFVEESIQKGALAGDDVATITEGLQELGILTPEQLKRAQLFQRRGVAPLRANLTQSTDDFRDVQDAVKRSGVVAEAVADQDASLARVVAEGIEAIGPAANNVVQTNANVIQSVDNVIDSLDAIVDASYSAARRAAPTAKNIKYTKLSEKLRSSAGLENASGGVPSALRGELRNKGILTKESKFDPVGLTDVKTAEGVRQFLNSLHDPANPRGNSLIRELKGALDDDVAAVVGEDVFKFARQAKIDMQRIIQRGARSKRDKTKGSFLEDVISNKIPEEKIVPKLLSGRDDDLIKFKRFLLQDSGPQGKQAWQDIKGQVLRNALDKATSTQGKVEGGGAVFNSRLFSNEFKNLRGTKKYNELFNLDERELIEDIIEIGSLRVPPRAVAQGSGPSGLAVDAAKREIINKIPFVGPEAQALMDNFKNTKADVRQLDPLKETKRAVKGPNR